MGAMHGKRCVVSGANSGIGRCIAEGLAREGARVTMICRNSDKGERARDEIRSANEGAIVDLKIADLSSVQQTKRVAQELLQDDPKLDVLVNNAGVYLPDRQVSEDGYEMMFALNHIGYFVLTDALLPALKAAPSARIVSVASAAHAWGHLDFDDLQCERSFAAMKQYGTTKLAYIVFTRELAKRLDGTQVSANCFHPGAVGTGFALVEPGFMNFVMKIGKIFLRTPAGGARTGLFLATSPKVEGITGEYFANEKIKRPSKEARDPQVAHDLWQATEEILSATTAEVI